MSLSGKTAVVTGSNSGIGLGIAQEFARRGAHIAINSFTDTPEDHELAAKIAKEHGVDVHYIQADMSDAEATRGLITKANDLFGKLDIVVNNAGIQFVTEIDKFPIEKWDQIISINLSSSFHTSAAAVPIMRENGWGRIVNIASAHGLRASPFKAAYVAAKHGVVGLSKVIALETAQEPITCNAICPGYVLTPLVEKQIPDTMAQYNMSREDVIKNVILEAQPSKEFAAIGEVAGTAAFLCSDDAAQITGTTISVDGGWTAR
ncbi:MAG: 3-hydroxybutyrate dehydrogenase [Pseudomonadota bacterium]